MKKSIVLMMLVLITAIGCNDSNKPQAESQRINQWFDEAYEEQLRFSPIMLAALGRKELYDQFDDMSEAAEDQKLEWYKRKIAEMKSSFDYEQLDLEAQTSWDLFEYYYQQRVLAKPFRRNHYIFEQMGGPQSSMPTNILSFHKIDDSSDMQAYIKRVSGMARALRQMISRAEKGIEIGVRPPQFAYDEVIKQSRKLITGQPFEQSEKMTALWKYGIENINKLEQDAVINKEQSKTFEQELAQVLIKEVGPAYEALIALTESDRANAAPTAESTGIVNLPNAKAYYQERLNYNTTTDLTAEQIHQIGLNEVTRITKEMMLIKEQVNFKGDLKTFFDFIRTDEQFFYPNTDEGRQGYLDDSTAYIRNLESKLPDYFGLMPKAKLEVKRVEAFREQDGAAQHYMQGTPDGSRPGIYYAHLSDMTGMPKTDMEAVAYHEGNPGHHMQSSIQLENTSQPMFRRNEWLSAYGEGWALYTELLAKEMGAYQNPYSDFGRLSAEIWRAARLVVDTGLHHKGWTENEAVEYMMEVVPSTLPAMKAEVHRYQVWPGQATSYKIGMLKILELRAKAEQALGDRYDIRDFHDVVLGGGALPLALLEKRVNNWIAKNQL